MGLSIRTKFDWRFKNLALVLHFCSKSRCLYKFLFFTNYYNHIKLRNTTGTNYEFMNELMKSTKSRPVGIKEFTNILREELNSNKGWPTKGVLTGEWDAKETL